MVSRLLRAVTESASANERFKAGWGPRVAVGVVAAVAAHAGLFLAFPTLHADDLGAAGDPSELINVPPEAYIPSPPDEIVRPAAPRVGDVDVDDIRTIPIPEWDRNPPRQPSPPSVRGEEGPIVTPYRDGRLLFEVPAPARFERVPPYLSAETVAVVAEGEMGVDRVRVYDLRDAPASRSR